MVNRLPTFHIGTPWSTGDLAILRLLTSGPQLLTMRQVGRILSKSPSRSVTRRCQRLIQRGWLQRYELLERLPRQGVSVRISPQAAVDWRKLRNQRKQRRLESTWQTRRVLVSSRQTCNLLGQQHWGLGDLEQRAQRLNWGDILVQSHQHLEIESWYWLWSDNTRQRVLGIQATVAKTVSLIGSLAFGSQSDWQRLRQASRTDTLSWELW